MRISDWSSDVCSSDLPAQGIPTTLEHLLATVTNFQVPTILQALIGDPGTAYDGDFWRVRSPLENDGKITVPTFIVGGLHDLFPRKIGRAAGRDRVWQ